jgi:hypothetical protein
LYGVQEVPVPCIDLYDLGVIFEQSSAVGLEQNKVPKFIDKISLSDSFRLVNPIAITVDDALVMFSHLLLEHLLYILYTAPGIWISVLMTSASVFRIHHAHERQDAGGEHGFRRHDGLVMP